jgi:hypothetical protein
MDSYLNTVLRVFHQKFQVVFLIIFCNFSFVTKMEI